MSKVAIQGNASGTGTFTIQSPATNTDRVLSLPDEAGTVVTTAGANFTGDTSVNTDTLYVDVSEDRVGINTSAPKSVLDLGTGSGGVTATPSGTYSDYAISLYASTTSGSIRNVIGAGESSAVAAGIGFVDTGTGGAQGITFATGTLSSISEAMRIHSNGDIVANNTSPFDVNGNSSANGFCYDASLFRLNLAKDSGAPLLVNRNTNDGSLVGFFQAGIEEGNITVSGTTVSYNGGHLARWSRLADDSKDISIVKGTVMTNLDGMVEWSHDAVEAQDAVYDEEGSLVSDAIEAKEAYTEDNEQLNKMAVSSVEGDPNVAGVFVNWDEDDDEFNDMNIAMTGDMVIRIAQGTTVQRGDLLMSAGDGTAKPQDDDIVRSKTIAKVTSTHVSHTYDDGSYLVPCVLMAC